MAERAAIRQAFEQPDRKHAGEIWRHVAEQVRTRWLKLADPCAASNNRYGCKIITEKADFLSRPKSA